MKESKNYSLNYICKSEDRTRLMEDETVSEDRSRGLDKMADEILITDELAGHGNVMEFRKPNDLPFLIMRKRLEIPTPQEHGICRR